MMSCEKIGAARLIDVFNLHQHAKGMSNPFHGSNAQEPSWAVCSRHSGSFQGLNKRGLRAAQFVKRARKTSLAFACYLQEIVCSNRSSESLVLALKHKQRIYEKK
jgi:hypothetical protein